MRPNYAILVRALPADRLEDFVNAWLAHRVKDYVGHELWRGTGDMGRDVTGYLTAERMEGPWDNFQCKQLSKTLSETAAFVELGKIFMHAASGAFSLPHSYTFVAPRGVARAVQHFVAHPEQFRAEFFKRWDTEIAGRLVDRQIIPLSAEITEKIRDFDFRQVHWLDAARIVDHAAAKPALVHWFGEDPGRSPRGTVPDEVQLEESTYIGQLLRLYEEKGGGSYPTAMAALASPDFGTHLRDQRARFFDAVAFDRFYRDSTPDDYLVTFKDEIYHGVVDTHGEDYPNRLARLTQVMKAAAFLQPSGILGKHAGPQIKQGTCHQFANEGRLLWDR